MSFCVVVNNMLDYDIASLNFNHAIMFHFVLESFGKEWNVAIPLTDYGLNKNFVVLRRGKFLH